MGRNVSQPSGREMIHRLKCQLEANRHAQSLFICAIALAVEMIDAQAAKRRTLGLYILGQSFPR